MFLVSRNNVVLIFSLPLGSPLPSEHGYNPNKNWGEGKDGFLQPQFIFMSCPSCIPKNYGIA